MPPRPYQPPAWLARAVAIAALLFFFALGLRATLVLAPTNDEPSHVLRGYVLDSTGGLQFQTGHAPFSHRLIGSLLNSERTAPELEQLPSWPADERLQLASELMWQSGLDVDRFLFLARLPVLWMGLLLGGVIGSWALSWHGRGAMAVALILFATSPNLLASATLATTDFVTVVTYFGAIYAWWRFYLGRARRWWLLTAFFLGLAIATKLTAVLLLPVLFLLTLLFLRRDRPFWKPLASWLALLPAAALVLWLVYGLQIARLNGWPWPVPAAAYVASWQNVLDHVARGHRAFFMGRLSGDGWWSYFPVTFLIKTPLVTLVLLVIGALVIARRREMWPTAAFLFLPVVVLFAAAMTSRLNIGYRHILPVIPFLIVAASTAVLALGRRPFARFLLALSLGWLAFSALRQQPHFLSYFNEAVGGSSSGYRYLGDSNLDWGQDLKVLAAEVERRGGRWLLSYAGPADPTYYGLTQQQLIDHTAGRLPFSPANPQPGLYAISANHWQGILQDADTFDWFRRQEIAGTVGGSILLYEVREQMPGSWIAHCTDPAPLLAPAAAETLVGVRDLRHVWFDCSQSWVLPGSSPGWYVTPQTDDLWPVAGMAPESAQRLLHVYRHRATDTAPSYDVYYWRGGQLLPEQSRTARAAESLTGEAIALPYPASVYATLEGYQIAGEAWTNIWQIEAAADQPLSMRAHLLLSPQAPPLIADALGYGAEQWQPGDTLWQRHIFPSLEGARLLESGLYNYQTLQEVGELLRLPAEASP